MLHVKRELAFLCCCCFVGVGMRLGPPGTSISNWPIVLARDDAAFGEMIIGRGDLPPCHFVPHIFHMTGTGIELGRPRWQVIAWAMVRPTHELQYNIILHMEIPPIYTPNYCDVREHTYIAINCLLLKVLSLGISTVWNSVASVRERNIPTARQPLIGKVSAIFCG
jgi:hypothetical protein